LNLNNILIRFDWNFQDLMQFENRAPDCTWIAHLLMKKNWIFKFVSFLDLLQEFDSNSIEFLTLVYLELDQPMDLILD
jgi:hypothetical protein